MALVIVLLMTTFGNTSYYYGKTDDTNEAAMLLKAKAHSLVNQDPTINQLKEMKKAYSTIYDRMINAVDGDLKSQLIAKRDGVIAVYDKKIEALRVLARRRKANRGIPGFFRKVKTGIVNIGNAVGKGGKWAGKTIGDGIVHAGKTVIRALPTSPGELIEFVLEHSSGSFSIKRIIKKIAVKSFKSRVEEKVFIELARNTKNLSETNQLILSALAKELNVEKEFEKVYQHSLEQVDEEPIGGEANSDIGYEGEDGYDDPEEISSLEETFWQLVSQGALVLVMKGDYALKDFAVKVASEEILTPLYDETGWSTMDSTLNYSIERLAEFESVIQQGINHQFKEEMVLLNIVEGSKEGEMYLRIMDFMLLSRYGLEEITEVVDPIIGSNAPGQFIEPLIGVVNVESDRDWNPVLETHTYETLIWIDEAGFLNIEGTVVINNRFQEYLIDNSDNGGSSYSTYYTIDLTYDFELMTLTVLNEETITPEHNVQLILEKQ